MRNSLILLVLIFTSCKVSNVDTSTSEKVINVDDSPEIPVILEYKEIVYSEGDTAITYDGDLIILDGRSYISLGTTAWINRKVVVVYK